MRVWVDEITENFHPNDDSIEELSEVALSIALISGKNKVRVVMVLPDGYEGPKHYFKKDRT